MEGEASTRSSNGRTPLMFICQTYGLMGEDDEERTANLIKEWTAKGVEKNALDNAGKTALDYLVEQCESSANQLREKGVFKEVLEGFLTGEEMKAGKDKSPNTTLLEARADQKGSRETPRNNSAGCVIS